MYRRQEQVLVKYAVFELRTFHLAGYLSGKAYEHLNQNKRFTNQLWVWCQCKSRT